MVGLEVGVPAAGLTWAALVLCCWTDCWTSRKRMGLEIASELGLYRNTVAPGVGLEPTT